MKKIIFNDKYGLTAAVLQGYKTMTRILIRNRMTEDDIKAYLKGYTGVAWKASHYKTGEVVAVAQAYKHIVDNHYFKEQCLANETEAELTRFDAGWDNKMFVKSYYMPHQIKITDIKVERLKDISDEDCMKEGIFANNAFEIGYGVDFVYEFTKSDMCYFTPREAFAALIDKINGKGTWENNPWVFAYSFKLIN